MPDCCARFCKSKIVFCNSTVKSLSATLSYGTGEKYCLTVFTFVRARTNSALASWMLVWLGNGFCLYKVSSSVFAACKSPSSLLFAPRLLIKYITDQPSNPRAITPKTTKNKFRLIQSMSEFYGPPEFHVDVEAKG